MVGDEHSQRRLGVPRLASAVDAVGGVLGARDAYLVVLDGPPLAGMPKPRDGMGIDWSTLSEHGYGAVVCLTTAQPTYFHSPLDRAWFPLDDLAFRALPEDPDQDARNVRSAADFIVDLRTRGLGAIIHCDGGRGRTGTVIGAALVRIGKRPETVKKWLNDLHASRGRPGWPEADWQFQQVLAAGKR